MLVTAPETRRRNLPATPAGLRKSLTDDKVTGGAFRGPLAVQPLAR
jgi:hypothetical protein